VTRQRSGPRAVSVPQHWREDPQATLVADFGGQECGHVLGDVLTGAREPGGRLPTTWRAGLPSTWPVTMADVPVMDITPQGGVLR
jgi:beta-glucosidase